MGIKELYKFMKESGVDPLVCPLSVFAGCTVAIDVNYFMYNLMCVAVKDKLDDYYRSKDRDVVVKRWLEMFTNKYKLFTNNDIKTIWIFDGQAPKEKLKTQEERQVIRSGNKEVVYKDHRFENMRLEKKGLKGDVIDDGYRLTLEDLSKDVRIEWEEGDLLKKHLKELGATVIIDPVREAEELCAKMCREGDADAAYSADSDLVAYGCPVIIKSIEKGMATVITTQQVLDSFGFDKDQLLTFCVLLGTDYNKRVHLHGPIKCYRIVRNYDNVMDYFKEKELDTSCLDFDNVRNRFLK